MAETALELAELESVCDIFWRFKYRVNEDTFVHGLRANLVTSQLPVNRNQVPKLCLLYLGRIWDFRDPRISF